MASERILVLVTEHVVADDLDFLPSRAGEDLPALPVAFGDAVLDADYRVLVRPCREIVGELLALRFQLLRGEAVFPVLEELRAGAIESDRNLRARRISGRFDSLDDEFERGLVVRQVWRKTAFIALPWWHAFLVEQIFSTPGRSPRRSASPRGSFPRPPG